MIDYHWVFPLMAMTIYCFTPKGCNKTINWILTGLFVLIWSFEEAIIRVNDSYETKGLDPYFTGGIWYEFSIALLFGISAFLFYRAGGKVQSKLALVGIALCSIYAYLGNTGLYYEETFRADYYYVEAMILLYLSQLFVSTGGMMFALFNKWTGKRHGIIFSHSGDNSRNHHANRGDT